MTRGGPPDASGVPRDAEGRIGGGWIAPDVAEEFPALALRWMVVPGTPRSSPKIVRFQLEELSDAIDARRAIGLRERATVSAYRVFGRQLGLDPDVDRGPLEAALVERMMRGAFLPQGLPADACTIAAVQTGVPVWAIDADALVGSLGIRVANAGEALGRGRRAVPVAEESLVIADERGPLSALLEFPGPDVAPRPRGMATALFAISVPGAPWHAVDEALWLAGSIASERG
jgi:DNA/RNA-binding domain of Phe-tRNA-synthetase-like protein